MSTAISLLGDGFDAATADRFFGRIRDLENVLSRFKPDSDIARLTRGELSIDDVDPAVRAVLRDCVATRALTSGDFDHEPAPGQIDVNAIAKGWIIQDAALVLRMSGGQFVVNAGGDVAASACTDAASWVVGVQHPIERDALLGTFEVRRGAVATSGTYERGDHIRRRAEGLLSVTVVGPDLGQADGLSTAVFASGDSPPRWWRDVDRAYGLLTMSDDNRLRWLPPTGSDDIIWRFPEDADVTESAA
jgi:thiamine biosynthesis lipoprotein